MVNKLLLLVSITLAGCGNVTAHPGDDTQGADAKAGDAAVPDLGPHSHGFSAAGRRTKSAHFVLVSVTGQPTPVARGRSTSPQFVHVPGILGGQ